MTRFVSLSIIATLLLSLCVLTSCSSEKPRPGAAAGGSSSSSSSSSDDDDSSDSDDSDSSATAAPAPDQEVGDAGDGWGTLVMHFTYGGDTPTQPTITPTKDPEVCGQHELIEEWRIVSADNSGLANVLVWMLPESVDDLRIHDSYDATAEEPVIVDNQGCRFEPHISVLRTTQPFVVTNADPVSHNTKGEPPSNTPFNFNVSQGAEITVTPALTKAERRPFPISCSVHPWMQGYVLLQDHPYCAVSGPDGELRIENLPAGTWEFQVWQEKVGYVTNVAIDGEDTSWARGRFTVTIEPDTETDMGDIVVPADEF